MYGLNNSTGPNLVLVKKGLDKLLTDELKVDARMGRAEATDPLVFTQEDAPQAAAINTSVMGGGGYFDDTVDDVGPQKDAAMKAEALKTTIVNNFKKNLRISRTFMEDQQESAVSKAVKQQARTWQASQQRKSFAVYALGFTSQNTIDGTTLFSNSHTNENGDTIDNYETGVLTDDNLNVVVDDLRTQIDQTGVIVGYEPDFLLVPSALHRTAAAITKSVLRAGGAQNDLNYWSDFYPGMKCVYNPHLNSTSTTAYFVGTRGHDVIRWEREAFFTKLVPWETAENDTYVYKMRAREVVDSITYCGLVGSDGTV